MWVAGGCRYVHTLVECVVWAFGDGSHGRARLAPTRVDPQRVVGAQITTVAAGLFH